MAKNAAIEVRHLIKKYKGAVTPAVSDISFTIEKGEIWGLLGPNGAGKTSTISMLCGLIKPTNGEIFIHNYQFSGNTREIKQLISMVPQDIALSPSLTAYENLYDIGNMYGLEG